MARTARSRSVMMPRISPLSSSTSSIPMSSSRICPAAAFKLSWIVTVWQSLLIASRTCMDPSRCHCSAACDSDVCGCGRLQAHTYIDVAAFRLCHLRGLLRGLLSCFHISRTLPSVPAGWRHRRPAQQWSTQGSWLVYQGGAGEPWLGFRGGARSRRPAARDSLRAAVRPRRSGWAAKAFPGTATTEGSWLPANGKWRCRRVIEPRGGSRTSWKRWMRFIHI